MWLNDLTVLQNAQKIAVAHLQLQIQKGRGLVEGWSRTNIHPVIKNCNVPYVAMSKQHSLNQCSK
jgi:hypothetical protein